MSTRQSTERSCEKVLAKIDMETITGGSRGSVCAVWEYMCA